MRGFIHPSTQDHEWQTRLYSTMIPFSIAPKLLVLCLLLILHTVADDSNLTDPPLGQQAAVGFSPSVTDDDDAFGSIVNQPVIQNEADLPGLSDGLMETPKSLLLTDAENVGCAAGSPHAQKKLRRSSSLRRLSKRQRNDFCSPQDHENLRLEPPSSKPGANDIPAGQQGKAGVERPRGSMEGQNEFIPDPMLSLKKNQLYGKPNSAICPSATMGVPVCTPYDQQFTSPADFLVPCRFCMCFYYFFFYYISFSLFSYDFS